MKTFTINGLTLVCPDGTEKTMEETGMDIGIQNDEYYAEWNDIGVFYYPRTQTFIVQGQTPTYKYGEELDESDGIVVRIHSTGA